MRLASRLVPPPHAAHPPRRLHPALQSRCAPCSRPSLYYCAKKAYRHGLRASEVCDLQWQQIELSEGRLHVHRVKNGIPSVHPIRGDEMRALRKLRRDYPKDAYVFVSERGGNRLIQRVGEAA